MVDLINGDHRLMLSEVFFVEFDTLSAEISILTFTRITKKYDL